jgi:hypothetical protein
MVPHLSTGTPIRQLAPNRAQAEGDGSAGQNRHAEAGGAAATDGNDTGEPVDRAGQVVVIGRAVAELAQTRWTQAPGAELSGHSYLSHKDLAVSSA